MAFESTSNKQYSGFIALSRYARWLPEESRRETWSETVDRYVDYFMQRVDGKDIPLETWDEIRNAIHNLDCVPSMRALMTAGDALDRDNVAGFNCSYLAINRQRAFDELMYILMCGTGVGFSCERQEVQQLPTVAEEFYESETTIVVPDSKIGWASSFRELISLLYAGKVPKWDLSKVRPAGASLKTFGGRASGPEPLDDLFRYSVNIFRNAAGRKLTSLEVHGMVCKIAEIVVVGGVRRSALISLSNLSDDRMRHAKSGQWWVDSPEFALANNSACYTEKPDMETFMREWLSLVESKSGERGIFNREASQKQAAKNGRRDATFSFGTNPCLHPDSMVETVNGRMKIKDIITPTQVYSMGHDGRLVIKPCSASWVSKKDAATLNITVASGKVVRCTPDHKIYIEGKGWVEAQDIKIGDRVVHLVRNRRGAAYSGVKLTAQDKRDFVMEHRLVWEAVNGPVPDGYDIHHIDGDTYNNDVDNLECLSHSDHSSLTRYECDNDHMVSGYREYSPGRHGSMFGFVSQGGPKPKRIIPMPEELKSGLHQYASVVKIEEGETTDVYDLTVEDTHNFIADFVVVHNCSEIILRDRQFCNLSEVVVRHGDSFDDLKQKVRIATILGSLQATLTDFRYLSKAWKINTEEEALLGVSLTGIMDHPVLSGQEAMKDNGEGSGEFMKQELKDWLDELKNVAIETNLEWSEKLGIKQSTAITCVKPSGTVSQLVDSASGIHPRYSPYYIRTVRADKKDPLAKFMKDRGFPVEDDVMKPDSTYVFSFPMKAPEDAVFRDDRNAIEQLEHWLTYQRHWCEHKPSVTIYVKDSEWMDVGAWVYRHFDEMSGVSFLPHSDHTYRQAPYQEITEAEYNDWVKRMPTDVNWEDLGLYEFEDRTTSSQTMACTGGLCEVVDLA